MTFGSFYIWLNCRQLFLLPQEGTEFVYLFGVVSFILLPVEMRASGRLLTRATRIRVGLRYVDSIGTSIHATNINQGSLLTVHLLPCWHLHFILFDGN